MFYDPFMGYDADNRLSPDVEDFRRRIVPVPGLPVPDPPVPNSSVPSSPSTVADSTCIKNNVLNTLSHFRPPAESQDAKRTQPSSGYTSKVRVLDRYKVVGFISSGTYGRVYKAVGHNGQSGEFAIKKFGHRYHATGV